MTLSDDEVVGRASIGLIRPMLATPGAVPMGPGWSFEFKWDGIRAVGYTNSGGTRLLTRNDRDVSEGHPEIAELTDKHDLVLVGLGGRAVMIESSVCS